MTNLRAQIPEWYTIYHLATASSYQVQNWRNTVSYQKSKAFLPRQHCLCTKPVLSCIKSVTDTGGHIISVDQNERRQEEL